MKIYFEDGQLRPNNQLPIKPDFFIDASNGISSVLELLDYLRDNNKNYIIYTNSIAAFQNQYAWNKELQVPDIYIRAGEYMLFTRIDKLTNRELREGHNLAKLYIAGEFETPVLKREL